MLASCLPLRLGSLLALCGCLRWVHPCLTLMWPGSVQVRFYSDDAALTFVRREFPEYFEAYLNLPKDVERADFFRCVALLAVAVQLCCAVCLYRRRP